MREALAREEGDRLDLSRLFERYSLGSRAELAARAVREGWLDVPPIG